MTGLTTHEFIALAGLRSALRVFMRQTEQMARRSGLTPQRHLLLLMIKGAPDGSERSTVTELPERLQLAQSTVTELVRRAEEAGLGAAPTPWARVWYSERTAGQLEVLRPEAAKFCVVLPPKPSGYRIVDFVTGRPGQGLLRLHLTDDGGLRVVGVERPERDDPP